MRSRSHHRSPRNQGADRHIPRLHTTHRIQAGESIPCDADQRHRLVHVLRLDHGAQVLCFHEQDGEWECTLQRSDHRGAVLLVPSRQVRAVQPTPDLHFVFAPLKRERMDYMIQKATEMGATRLVPVTTQYTSARLPESGRLRSYAVGAAEQCGLLGIPTIDEPVTLEHWLTRQAQNDPTQPILFADERGVSQDWEALMRNQPRTFDATWRVLIGPEGGFSESERSSILALPQVLSVRLGPRIMRADTAAVAALAMLQLSRGDW